MSDFVISDVPEEVKSDFSRLKDQTGFSGADLLARLVTAFQEKKEALDETRKALAELKKYRTVYPEPRVFRKHPDELQNAGEKKERLEFLQVLFDIIPRIVKAEELWCFTSYFKLKENTTLFKDIATKMGFSERDKTLQEVVKNAPNVLHFVSLLDGCNGSINSVGLSRLRNLLVLSLLPFFFFSWFEWISWISNFIFL